MTENTWEVYDSNKNYIDTVYFVKNLDENYVRSSLINHDGYPADIEVILQKY